MSEEVNAVSDHHAYSAGDPCPRCGKAMTYDEGEELTFSQPFIAPSVGCDDCGDTYKVKAEGAALST